MISKTFTTNVFAKCISDNKLSIFQTQNTTIADVAESGPGLIFVVYPTALSLFPLPQLWSALFFLTLLLIGMDSLVILCIIYFEKAQ